MNDGMASFYKLKISNRKTLTYSAYFDLVLKDNNAIKAIKTARNRISREILDFIDSQNYGEFFKYLLRKSSNFLINIVTLEGNQDYYKLINIEGNSWDAIYKNTDQAWSKLFHIVNAQVSCDLYELLFSLKLDLESEYCLQAMILTKGDVSYYLLRRSTGFFMQKGYKIEEYTSWQDLFFYIVEQSLIPEYILYTKALAPVIINKEFSNINKVHWEKYKKIYFGVNIIKAEPNSSQNKARKDRNIYQTVPSHNDNERKNQSDNIVEKQSPRKNENICPICGQQFENNSQICRCSYQTQNQIKEPQFFFCGICQGPSFKKECRKCCSKNLILPESPREKDGSDQNKIQEYRNRAKIPSVNSRIRASSQAVGKRTAKNQYKNNEF